MQSVAGFVRAPPTFSVLVVHGPALQARVRELLPRERYEVTGTDDPEQAIRIVHDSAPDLAFVSGDLASQPDVDIVRRLQTDPLSNVRGTYVILPAGASYDAEFVRQTGADGVLVEPLDAASFLRLVESHERHGSSTAQRSHKRLSSMAEGTVAEIAGALAEEIRTGIAEALRAGRNERVQVEDPSALMAVAWSAIGKVRSHLAEQSRGRVRFRGELASEAPTFLDFASVPEAAQPDADDAAIAEVLAGRRVLIADDDPAVLWFFAGLFREAGARVFDAPNGQAALELARRKRPDVVVSDILMPKIDGFALCRELKRDAQLAHVPVILLSWKEDFLQRMRELDAGANGYLRKESGSRAILAGVADLLRPLSRLREQLRGDDEVRGRVEGLGIVPLIESIAAVRPNARLSVRDAWNLFEVDIREGNQLGVTRTAADGAFARGEGVLVQLMGVTSGRFTITSSSTPLRAAVSLDKALTQALHTLAALLDAVSDKRLVHVALVAFDDEVLASLLDSTPTPLAEVVARFRAGETTASQLLLEGAFTPGELEEYLRELARRGAIKGVWAGDGTDLVAVARQERDERPGLLRHSSLPPRGLLEQDDAAAVGGKEARARAQARVEGTAQTSATAPAAHVSSVAELQSALGQGAPAAASSASVDAKVEPAARAPAADATPPPSAAAPRPQSAPQPLRFFLTIAALGAIGYAAVSTLERPVAHTPHAPSVPAPAAPASSVAAPSPPPAAVAATVAVAVAPA
ncbi:MAG TPA: response regulator, partial [Polyangiales bacterium]|nr:response regulator [Polyangiales bacterium]